MKVFNVMAASILGAALCLGFTACSDDDENGNGNDNRGDNTTMVVHPENVFTGGIPKSAAGMTITQNEEGLVTSITTEEGDKAVFEYFSASTKADVVIDQARITVTDSDGDVTELNLQLNQEGYVASCNSTDHAGTTDASNFTWKMEYDADGHLIRMERSEGDGEVTTLTYNEEGDVMATSTITPGDDFDWPASTIQYTTDEITTPVENKGCLMMFDELLDVDMDEMIYAYYAGMLGTATKHLPLKQHYPYNYDPNTGAVKYNDQYFDWEWDSNGYPTQLVIDHNTDPDDYSEVLVDRFSFTW